MIAGFKNKVLLLSFVFCAVIDAHAQRGAIAMASVVNNSVPSASVSVPAGPPIPEHLRPKKVAEAYPDAEHAFYKCQLRKGTVNNPYKLNATKDDYYVLVEKSKFSMSVYTSADELVATYPMILGNDDLLDKMCEGDNRTPEGTFHIINKKGHAQWYKYIGIDYPTMESYQKFNARKASGEIPANVGIGGGIGFHGTQPGEDIEIDRRSNWTFGCICTKNAYIDDLYNYIPIGTKVIIRH